MEQSLLDANSLRRIHPGTKAAEMAAGPPLVPLSEVNTLVLICVRPELPADYASWNLRSRYRSISLRCTTTTQPAAREP